MPGDGRKADVDVVVLHETHVEMCIRDSNCLLHVPSADLPRVLAAIHRLLQPNGLFYYGVYGGHIFEGIWPEDHHDPQRYFVFYPDDELRRRVAGLFDEVYFRAIPLPDEDGSHFQSLILRRKPIDL